MQVFIGKEGESERLRLERNKKPAELSNFKCDNYNKCAELKDFLMNKLQSDVFYHIREEGQPAGNPIADYNNSMSARQLMGVLRYINDFAARPMDTLHSVVNPTKKVVHLFFNCHAESIHDALTKEVPSGYFEVSFY